MKAKELAALLLENPEREVILQRDPEGNGHSPFCDTWLGHYVPSTTWYGDAYVESITEKDREAGFTEEDMTEDPNRQEAIFLVPVN